jgi:hypothetical protein
MTTTCAHYCTRTTSTCTSTLLAIELDCFLQHTLLEGVDFLLKETLHRHITLEGGLHRHPRFVTTLTHS